MVRVSILEALRFPGGYAIFKNQMQIDPRSDEGKIIQNILIGQKDELKSDTKQQQDQELIHGKDITRDGFIGDPKDEVKVEDIEKDTKKGWRVKRKKKSKKE